MAIPPFAATEIVAAREPLIISSPARTFPIAVVSEAGTGGAVAAP